MNVLLFMFDSTVHWYFLLTIDVWEHLVCCWYSIGPKHRRFRVATKQWYITAYARRKEACFRFMLDSMVHWCFFVDNWQHGTKYLLWFGWRFIVDGWQYLNILFSVDALLFRNINSVLLICCNTGTSLYGYFRQ